MNPLSQGTTPASLGCVTPSVPRPTLSAGNGALLGLLATAILLLGVIEWLEAGEVPEVSPLAAAAYPLAAWVYAATGLIAALRRPGNRMGLLLLVGGLALLGAGLAGMVSHALWGLGLLLSTTILAAMVHALHAFPTGRLRGRWSIATVIAVWVVSLPLQLPIHLFGPPSPLSIHPDPVLFELALWGQRGAGLAVMLSTAALLVLRVARAAPRQRRVLAPLYLYGIAAVLLVLLAARMLEGVDPVLRLVIQMIVIAGVPVAFVIAMLLGGFAQVGRLDDLSARLAVPAPSYGELSRALAATFGDPTIEVLYWSDSVGGYVDSRGSRVDLSASPDRGVVEVDIDGRRVGTITYDRILVGERDLVESAARVVALAIDRDRLEADLRARQVELVSAGQRLVVAAEEERRRIARDLHDGLQTRLVLLALAASELKQNPSAGETVQQGIESAISELRDLVHGVMPATLTERGLESAVRELAAQSAVPVTVEGTLDERRFEPAVETVAYLAVREALGNAVKYARASGIRVSLKQRDETLSVRVEDDGLGGAQAIPGHGIAGIRDRVSALQGSLAIDSPESGGTRVEVVLPCAS